jgi:CPA2 family monovalent cation:H+ antiporter-2
MDSSIFQVILILLTASVFVVLLFKQLKLSPVLGYFAAGAMIGDHGMKIVNAESTTTFGEFGIVFLLFAIGLELTFERLQAMRKHVFGFGTLQVLITGTIIGLIVYYLPSDFNTSGEAAIIIGGGLALSSTAIVLQVIAEYRRQSTQVGRLSLATLILQDFAVVPLLVLIPMLSGEQSNIIFAMSDAFLRAIIVLLAIFILGRLLLRPLFGMINSATSAKTNELFIGATLLIALGSAWLTEHWGLSLALGAFVAGLLVAETEFQHQAEESIAPFRSLFLGLFFMTVGMRIDVNLISENLVIILLFAIGLIVIKTFVITVLSLLFRFSLGTALHAGLLLSQASEFAFILFSLAVEKNIIDNQLGQMLLLVVTTTMALTPLLFIIGDHIADKLDKVKKVTDIDIKRETEDLVDHVIIIGFGRVGKMVARLLQAERVNFVAMDLHAQTIQEDRDEGFPVFFGDGSEPAILEKMGIQRAGSVIVAMENKQILKKVTRNVHKLCPQLPIIVRSEDLSNQKELEKLGANAVVPETYETGLQLGGAVLKAIGFSEFEVSRIKNRFRAGNYLRAIDEEDLAEIQEAEAEMDES